MDVVGRAQRGGDLVAGAAGAADVDDDPQRVPGGDARAARRAPRRRRGSSVRVDRLAGARGRGERARQQRLAVDRRAGGARRRARPSAATTATSMRTSRTARATASGSMRPVGATCSIADCVSEPTILCVEVSTASAPCWSADGGRSGWKPKCGPHAWSTTSGTPAACATSAQPGDVGGHPVVGRRDDERGAGVRRRAPAPRRARPGVTPWAMPSSSSYSGATKLGRPPESTSPSITEACELRCTTTGAPERREREAERVVALGRAVGQEPRARRAVGLGGELLGALVRRRLGPEVDALDVLRDVEQQRVLADRERSPGSAPAPRLVAGDVEARRAAEAVGDERVEVGRGRLVARDDLARPDRDRRVGVVRERHGASPGPAGAGRRGRSRRGRRRARGWRRPSPRRCGGP